VCICVRVSDCLWCEVASNVVCSFLAEFAMSLSYLLLLPHLLHPMHLSFHLLNCMYCRIWCLISCPISLIYVAGLPRTVRCNTRARHTKLQGELCMVVPANKAVVLLQAHMAQQMRLHGRGRRKRKKEQLCLWERRGGERKGLLSCATRTACASPTPADTSLSAHQRAYKLYLFIHMVTTF